MKWVYESIKKLNTKWNFNEERGIKRAFAYDEWYFWSIWKYNEEMAFRTNEYVAKIKLENEWKCRWGEWNKQKYNVFSHYEIHGGIGLSIYVSMYFKLTEWRWQMIICKEIKLCL